MCVFIYLFSFPISDASFALPADVKNSANAEGATSLAALPVNDLYVYSNSCVCLYVSVLIIYLCNFLFLDDSLALPGDVGASADAEGGGGASLAAPSVLSICV